jgi:hypothetical protein
MRHLFYECRNRYLRENPERLEIDSQSKAPYIDWEKTLKFWCQSRCEEFGIPPELWWRLREMLNIWPEGKATCEGESGRFLIEKETRHRVSSSCSFILLCEKRTVSRELLARLRGAGYKLNIVSTGGHSPADVQEAVMQIGEDLNEDPTFYCLILHDYDRDGVKILFTLRERYKGVIDIGVNRAFFQHWIKQGSFDSRLVEEQVLNKNYQGELRDEILRSGDYTLEDFDYLQGEQIGEKLWRGKRTEIDAVHVQYGIQPFIDYTMEKIREVCIVWDLSRIGVEEFELEEPPNHYRRLIGDLEDKVGRAYGQKLAQLSGPLNTVIDIVKETLTQPPEFEELEEKYRGSKGLGYVVSGSGYSYTYHMADVKGVDPIKEKFGEQMKRAWAGDYEDELEEINRQIIRYEGDVREGEEELKGQWEDLQESLAAGKMADPGLDRFSEELNEVEWGKEELEAIEVPDEADEIRRVIKALRDRLEELGEVS